MIACTMIATIMAIVILENIGVTETEVLRHFHAITENIISDNDITSRAETYSGDMKRKSQSSAIKDIVNKIETILNDTNLNESRHLLTQIIESAVNSKSKISTPTQVPTVEEIIEKSKPIGLNFTLKELETDLQEAKEPNADHIKIAKKSILYIPTQVPPVEEIIEQPKPIGLNFAFKELKTDFKETIKSNADYFNIARKSKISTSTQVPAVEEILEKSKPIGLNFTIKELETDFKETSESNANYTIIARKSKLSTPTKVPTVEEIIQKSKPIGLNFTVNELEIDLKESTESIADYIKIARKSKLSTTTQVPSVEEIIEQSKPIGLNFTIKELETDLKETAESNADYIKIARKSNISDFSDFKTKIPKSKNSTLARPKSSSSNYNQQDDNDHDIGEPTYPPKIEVVITKSMPILPTDVNFGTTLLNDKNNTSTRKLNKETHEVNVGNATTERDLNNIKETESLLQHYNGNIKKIKSNNILERNKKAKDLKPTIFPMIHTRRSTSNYLNKLINTLLNNPHDNYEINLLARYNTIHRHHKCNGDTTIRTIMYREKPGYLHMLKEGLKRVGQGVIEALGKLNELSTKMWFKIVS